jgi:hypothetical protein
MRSVVEMLASYHDYFEMSAIELSLYCFDLLDRMLDAACKVQFASNAEGGSSRDRK